VDNVEAKTTGVPRQMYRATPRPDRNELRKEDGEFYIVLKKQRELVILKEIFSTFAEYGQKLHEVAERICKEKIENFV
jgi:hypothetical protein